MWIPKNSITGQTYGHKFRDIYDCQQYIDTELKELNDAYRRAIFLEYCYFGKLTLGVGNVIRCYNTSQKRFCDGFDF